MGVPDPDVGLARDDRADDAEAGSFRRVRLLLGVVVVLLLPGVKAADRLVWGVANAPAAVLAAAAAASDGCG